MAGWKPISVQITTTDGYSSSSDHVNRDNPEWPMVEAVFQRILEIRAIRKRNEETAKRKAQYEELHKEFGKGGV